MCPLPVYMCAIEGKKEKDRKIGNFFLLVFDCLYEVFLLVQGYREYFDI